MNPSDDEDLALTLNRKKKKIRRADFIASFNTLKLGAKQQQNIFRRMNKAREKWMDFFDISFLSQELKEEFKSKIQKRFARLEV